LNLEGKRKIWMVDQEVRASATVCDALGRGAKFLVHWSRCRVLAKNIHNEETKWEAFQSGFTPQCSP
jgi:hypothetical protein